MFIQILKYKKKIMWTQAVLIVFGFINHYGFKNLEFGNWAFLVAGIIGTVPLGVQAISALRVKVISIDTLVLVASIGALLISNYEESAIVTFLFLFGSWLEGKTLDYTRSSIKELTDMAPEKALVLQENGQYQQVDIYDVNIGDTVVVRPGAKVPVDGTIISGSGYINESTINGEPTPINKHPESPVYAGTILENGAIELEVTAIGEDTTFGRIIELVEEAQDSKSAAERFIDKFARYYTPAVIVVAFLVWVINRDVELAITVLVLGCPGALVIGVPVSNVAGIGNGARNGVLLKGSETIQEFAKIDTVIFDKTGTLTIGAPKVTAEKYYTKKDPEVLRLLAAVEQTSDHPLAQAILEHVGSYDPVDIEEIETIEGGGLVAIAEEKTIAVGNLFLMEKLGYTVSKEIRDDISQYQNDGHSIALTAVDREVKSLMGIKDPIRPRMKEDLIKLKDLGIKNLALASGDNQGAVDLVATELGLTEAVGNMLPEDKADYVKSLQQKGHKVAFVGDGINDTPSLATADIGIGIGAGTDVAIETSDVVLVNSDFTHLNHAYGLSRSTSQNMIQNIVIAVGMVIVLVLMLLFTDWMNMGIGMLLHEGSILMVILNAMRLLNYKISK